MLILSCFGIFTSLIFVSVDCEVYSAIADLEPVLHAENAIADEIKDYISSEMARLEKLKNFATSYMTHSREALQDPQRHLSNPINAFLLVKRFTSDWSRVHELIKTNSSDELLNRLSRQAHVFPTSEDLTGAATALLRLQDTYALPTTKISKGELQGIQTSTFLTAGDCFELGRLSYESKDYYHTYLWMEETLIKLNNETAPTANRALTLDYQSYAAYMQGNLNHALRLTKELVKLDSTHQRAQSNIRYYEQLISEREAELHQKGDTGEGFLEETQPKNERNVDEYRRSEEFLNYEALCRGEDTHDTSFKDRLTCQYKRHHPAFYISPLREETMYEDPWIVIYHDVMTPSQISRIQDLARPNLKRATVQNPLTGKLETAFYRVSKSAWLKDSVDPIIDYTSKYFTAMTNLSMETAEELQVVNYGIGGQYEPHYDFARKHEYVDTWTGNRVNTVLCYMTDVTAGGATVFPSIGVKLWPKAGSCAVWYNLKRSGEGAFLTRHAGCPVLTGNKWVCNKWIHERGQEFRRPCSLDPAE